MLILDCSSRTQALHTLSAGFACPPEKLKKVLLSLDLESIYELNPRQLVDAPQYLREYVCAELGEPGPFTRALLLDVNYLGRYASTTLAAFELFLS